MKLIALYVLILTSQSSLAVPTGFNQAWFNDAYGHQYMDYDFDLPEVKRIFKLAKSANAHSLRLWFFEGSELSMINFDGNTPVELKEEFTNNVISTLRAAKEIGVKVYFTVFDAQAYKIYNDPRDRFLRLRSLFSKFNGQNFLDNILTPLLRKINDAGLADAIDKFDLANEMDLLINRFGFKNGWRGAKRMLCQWKEAISSTQGFETTPVSFSIRLHPFIMLPLNILSDKGPMKCADFFDFHTYSNQGSIHRCSWVRRYANKNKKKVILGEFGQGFLNHRYSDDLQVNVTKNFIYNAKVCGFSESFAWRLSDIRPGYNKESRYSYEAHGKLRPGYYVIQKHNEINR
jgi:hypothetical protein